MENPYQASVHGGAPPPSAGNTPLGAIQGLAETKPWVRFCSVIGFIVAGLMVLFGLIMVGSSLVIRVAGTGGREMGLVGAIGIFYFLIAAIYLIPAIKLWKYGNAILRLMMSGATSDLEEAMEQQRGFWKSVGILVIIGMMLSGIAMATGIFAAAGTTGAANRQRTITTPPVPVEQGP